ncbi:MAG TPA: hypothetical protein VK427_18180 [Kofleriaceae bacterium]|nr:hypothetical protein [Kofleriaceae bacterium]
MRFPVALVLLSACTAMQDASTVEQQEGACVALEDRRFESVNELECGRGVGTCKWSLSFATRDDLSSGFQWSYSDVAEAGQIECQGAAINSLTARPISGTFDPVSQKLVWEGQTYAPAN